MTETLNAVCCQLVLGCFFFLVPLNTKVSRQTEITFSDNLQLVPISQANHIEGLMKVVDHRQHKVKPKQIRNSSGL